MKLKELLSITTMETNIIIDGINDDRVRKNLTGFNNENEYRILTNAWDDIIKEYGEYRILNQSIENGKLKILVKSIKEL